VPEVALTHESVTRADLVELNEGKLDADTPVVTLYHVDSGPRGQVSVKRVSVKRAFNPCVGESQGP